MAWVRIDDKFHANRKVYRAGNAALGLWLRCLSWAAQNETDGTIPDEIAMAFGTRKEATALVNAGLWVSGDGEYHVPDFLEFNFSKAENEERRAKRAAAGRLGGRRSGEVRRSKAEANASPIVRESFDHGEANTNPEPEPEPEPVSTQVTTPPTDCVQPSRRVAEIADRYTEIAFERAKGVSDERAWKQATRSRVAAEPELVRLAEMFPTAPPDAVAAWLHGDKGSMAYYPRVDELAEVVPFPTERTDSA